MNAGTRSTANNMVMNMINWFGDANGFVGNLALKPEGGLYRQRDG